MIFRYDIVGGVVFLTTTTMVILVDSSNPWWTEADKEKLKDDSVNIDDKKVKEYILTQLATVHSDDVDFLRKVNKLTFGLQSGM
jgi:hypothetical protein